MSTPNLNPAIRELKETLRSESGWLKSLETHMRNRTEPHAIGTCICSPRELRRQRKIVEGLTAAIATLTKERDAAREDK